MLVLSKEFVMDVKEIDALRLYGGDTRTRNAAGLLIVMESQNPYYGDKEAYQTINALLFLGTSSEYSRIYLDRRKLNPIFLVHPFINTQTLKTHLLNQHISS